MNKETNMIKEQDLEELCRTILSIENVEDCKYFLDDLCTYKEIEQFSQRLKAARLLLEGKTYEQVISETEISSATLSRVSRCVKYGKGYNRVIKTENKNDSDK